MASLTAVSNGTKNLPKDLPIVTLYPVVLTSVYSFHYTLFACATLIIFASLEHLMLVSLHSKADRDAYNWEMFK